MQRGTEAPSSRCPRARSRRPTRRANCRRWRSTRRPPVEYPPALFDQGIEGTVILRLFVDSSRQAGPGLDPGAGIERIPRARFRRGGRLAQLALRAGAPRRRAGGGLLPAADLLPSSRRRGDHAVTPPHLTPYDTVLDTIGWTPLIRLGRVGAGVRTPVYGKAEYANPGGSVKDRIGLAIIEDAERRGELKAGGTIVEGTSGNTGVGLAIAAALKGYRCIFTMPDKMSQEKVRLLKAYGAEVVITPTAVPPDHPDNYVMKAKQIVKDTPGAVLANQFYNPVNPEAHYRTTGPEIWEQTGGRVTHFVAGRGHRRHGERRRQVPQGEEPEDPRHRRRPGGLALHRLFPHEDDGRGRALQGGRHRRRQDPDHHPVRADRRVPPAGRSGIDGHGAAARPRGGDAARRLRGAQRGPGAPGGARGGRPGGLRRHHPLRHRRAVPQQALQ